MRMKWDRALKKPLAVAAICFVLAAQYVLAQNLGQNPPLCHSERRFHDPSAHHFGQKCA